MTPIQKTLAMLLITGLTQAHAAIKSATDDESLGLYPAGNFRLGEGRCTDCQAPPQALWYFSDELVATPRRGMPAAGFDPMRQVQQDIKLWGSRAALNDQPNLIWVGSTKVIDSARLSIDGQTLTLDDGRSLHFATVPKLPSNRSYYNATTQRFYSEHPLKLRGELSHDNGRDTFRARTVWPKDFTLGSSTEAKPLAGNESLRALVRANHGGATSAFQQRVLWERSPGAARMEHALSAIGIMLNGAQGDDDEAHGGHFAVATGRLGAEGDWSHWLVNNFYNLDAYSEKGIVAATTPMDKYLMDINSGQSFYRPSYMIVALFKNDTPALQYQAAMNRVFNHLYRHDFSYHHSRSNCAGISVDTFQTLGWNIPHKGPTGYLKAIAAYAYIAASEHSLDKGRNIYDYLTEDQTRLYPAVAFDEMGNDLLKLAQGQSSRALTPYERSMADNIEAILFVNIPQVPSSRAYGMAPVYSFDEYMKRVPADHSQWQIVPTQPRLFPVALRDGEAVKQTHASPLPLPVASVGFVGGMAILGAAARLRRRRYTRQKVSGSMGPGIPPLKQ